MTDRKRRVLWTLAARRDFHDIIIYIARDSNLSAARVAEKIKRAAAALTTAPQRGRVVPELAWLGIVAWRELIVAPYRIIYRIDGRTVWVTCVLDGRRDLQDLLIERLVAVELP